MVLAFVEKCRHKLLEVLPGIGAFSAPGKEVVLLFRDRATCDRYLSLYSGGDRFLGGGQVRQGYPHIAATGMNYDHLEDTLAHELTHLSLRHLRSPQWLEEGLAQMFSQDMTGLNILRMTPKAAREQKRHWKKHGLTAFWGGSGFGRADDDQCAMCYDRTLLLDLAATRVLSCALGASCAARTSAGSFEDLSREDC